MTQAELIESSIAIVGAGHQLSVAAERALLKLLGEMKDTLVEYHNAEEAYKAVGSTERYGRYQVAAERVTALAKRMANKTS